MTVGWKAWGTTVRVDVTDPDALPSAVVQVSGLSRTALILGSGQKEAIADLADAEAAGVDVARRRSGGGAVLLAPGRSLWIDVLLPREDPRWSDDVVDSSVWLERVC